MRLPLHALFKDVQSIEIVADNAKVHSNSLSQSRKRKDRAPTLTFPRSSSSASATAAHHPRLGHLNALNSFPSATESLGNRWDSNPVKPKKRSMGSVPSHSDDVMSSDRLDCSPTKPSRMTYNLSDCTKLSLSMPRRPLRKPFIDISVVKGDRFERSTADMISKVLEELELPDSDDDASMVEDFQLGTSLVT